MKSIFLVILTMFLFCGCYQVRVVPETRTYIAKDYNPSGLYSEVFYLSCSRDLCGDFCEMFVDTGADKKVIRLYFPKGLHINER